MIHGLISRLYQPAWYWSFAFLLAGFYVATSLYISSQRLLWFDEICTAIVTRLPDLATMWKALSESADSVPPLYFLITRIFDKMVGHADVGIRIPSALALGAGMLVTFDIARRLTDGLYGLIAMSFLTTSFVTYYGYEARPYALYFMLAAMALWVWLFTKDESKTAAAAFGALFLIGVAIHYYFLLCLVPFGIFAMRQRRLFHLKVFAAAVGVMGCLAVFYQQIGSSLAEVREHGSFTPPSMGKVQSVYVEFFPNALIPLMLIAVCIAVFGKSRERLVTSMTSGERVSWLFLVVPLATYVAAQLVTHFFYNRYMIGAVPGIVVAVTCLFWRHCRESRHLSLALLCFFCGVGISQQLRTLMHIDHIPAFGGDHQEQTRQMLSLEDTLRREGKRHFAVANELLFLEAWYYSRYPEQYQYVTPSFLNKYAALKFVSTEEIVTNARQTALISPRPSLAEALERADLHLKVRFAEPYVAYLE